MVLREPFHKAQQVCLQNRWCHLNVVFFICVKIRKEIGKLLIVCSRLLSVVFQIVRLWESIILAVFRLNCWSREFSYLSLHPLQLRRISLFPGRFLGGYFAFNSIQVLVDSLSSSTLPFLVCQLLIHLNNNRSARVSLVEREFAISTHVRN